MLRNIKIELPAGIYFFPLKEIIGFMNATMYKLNERLFSLGWSIFYTYSRYLWPFSLGW